MADVTFFGACGTVTGSCSLLRFGSTRLLVDCGLYQGDDELEERNRAPFPFRPSELAAVVLTHAHLDHSGLLPRLCAEGFTGPIFCTRPTKPLAALVLEDSAELQEEEARFARKKGYSRHEDPQPLYTMRDVSQALRLLEPLRFGEEHEIQPGLHLTFRRAGHLLGAATVELAAKGSDGVRRRWCFSGDVGRYDAPILHDPDPPDQPLEALLLESTYGDRRHPESDPTEALAEVLTATFARGGTLLVPAFALGRTQDVLYHLSELAERKIVDPEAVFLDSPMAIRATEIYRQATPELDEDMQRLVRNHVNPLAADRFTRCRTVDESKAINERNEPSVIVAASGMATGGRIVHHLAQRLGDPRNTVLFVGYQAAGTRGRALVDGAKTVSIHGRPIAVEADVRQIGGLSAHADSAELLRWCRELKQAPRRIFLNHGEDPARKALAAALRELGWPRPELPRSGAAAAW